MNSRLVRFDRQGCGPETPTVRKFRSFVRFARPFCARSAPVEGAWRDARTVGYPLPVFVGGRRLAVACAVTGMLIAGAGCGGSGSGPRTLPPLTTAPAAGTTTSPTGDAAKAELHDATAVVREYFAVINRLSRRMDAGALAALSSPSCKCRAFVRDVRVTAGKHEHYFGRIHLVGLTAAADGPDQAEVLATYDSGAGGTAADDGHVLFRGQPHKNTVQNFVLRKVSDRWLIIAINLIKKGAPA